MVEVVPESQPVASNYDEESRPELAESVQLHEAQNEVAVFKLAQNDSLTMLTSLIDH